MKLSLNHPHARRRLAAEIQAVFANGLPLTDEVLRYIDTTLGPVDAPTIIEFLRTDTDGAAESLLELLFTPDMEVRLLVEPVLHGHDFDMPDEERIFEHLRTACPRTTFLFPDGRPPLVLEIPENSLRRFISLLNIRKRIPAELKTAVSGHVDADMAGRVLVGLRVAPFDFHPPFTGFLKALLETLSADPFLLLSCLDFCLDGRLDLHKTDHPRAALIRIKERNETILRECIAMDINMAAGVVETRMLQGIRPPAVNRETLLADLRRINAILGAACDLTEESAGADLAINGWVAFPPPPFKP